MAKKALSTKGLNETIANLEALANISNINALEKRALYVGAGTILDGMLEEIASLKITRYYGTTEKKRYCWPSEVKALTENIGIAKMIVEDTVNTKVGFDGYYEADNGESYPVPLISNSINAGTSFMNAQPFIDNTVRKYQKQALKEMEKNFVESMQKVMK